MYIQCGLGQYNFPSGHKNSYCPHQRAIFVYYSMPTVYSQMWLVESMSPDHKYKLCCPPSPFFYIGKFILTAREGNMNFKWTAPCWPCSWQHVHFREYLPPFAWNEPTAHMPQGVDFTSPASGLGTGTFRCQFQYNFGMLCVSFLLKLTPPPHIIIHWGSWQN